MSEPAHEKPKGWLHQTSIDEFVEDVSKFLNDPVKHLMSLLSKAWGNQRELRILVTGKTGQGKSTLINGIIGDIVAEEGARATRCTTTVKEFTKDVHGVSVKVFDSPGLQDRTQNEEEYIQDMREKCKELSLVLYCTKMINHRLTDDDRNAMKKLTEAFGEKFWNYGVLVLTFANMEDCGKRDDRDEDIGEEPDYGDEDRWRLLKKKRFEGRLKLWEKDLKQFLIQEVGVNKKIAQQIPVVPTGDHVKSYNNRKPMCLPDRNDWFNKFWTACCLRVKDQKVFLEVNQGRIIVADDDDSSGTPKSKETKKCPPESPQKKTKNTDFPEEQQKKHKNPPPILPKPVRRRNQGLPTSESLEPQGGSHTSEIENSTSDSLKMKQPNISDEASVSIEGLAFQDTASFEPTSSDQITSTLDLTKLNSTATIKAIEEEPSVMAASQTIQPIPSDRVISSSFLPTSDSNTPVQEKTSISSQDTSQEPEPPSGDQVTLSPTTISSDLDSSSSSLPTLTNQKSKPSDQDHLADHKITMDKELVENLVEETMRRKYGDAGADLARKALSLIAKPVKWFVGLFKK